jgi:hypothetical protein
MGRDVSVPRPAAPVAPSLTDVQLALAIGLGLFVLAALPLGLVDVPPLQDLPNHLAAITVITHPDRYPNLVFNGFFKTNAALFTWLICAVKVMSPVAAARLFTLLVLAANALVLPLFVLRMTKSRARLVTASFVLWPMIHNWFVSMGMLDFALGVALALALVMVLEERSRAPSAKNAILVLIVGAAAWYAHVFGVLVAHLLVLVHLATRASWRERVTQAGRLFVPLVPVTCLALSSVYAQFTETVGPMTGYLALSKALPPWELAYNLWAEWSWGFTWLSISSFVPSVVIAVYAFRNRREEVPFFSGTAFLLLFALFCLSPYIATNWFHVSSRFIPFLWAAAILRLPAKLPKRLAALLSVSAVLYWAGMCIDYVRLDRDAAKFTAGMDAVPEGATLLPLVFRSKLTSENTRSLLHEWGIYVLHKHTSAPLLFAHSRSFPVMYKDPPTPRFNHLVLESLAGNMASPDWMCGTMLAAGVYVDDCEGEWRALWAEFWAEALPLFDHVLFWDPTPEVQALVPPEYRVAFHQGRLTIYERVP